MDSPPPPPSPPMVCLHCGKELGAARRKTKRYCSASCRTQAYALRVARRGVGKGRAVPADLPAWVGASAGEVPVLSASRRTLAEVAGTLDALSRRLAAEESGLWRDLDKVRAQLRQQGSLRRTLAQTQVRLAERERELAELRRQQTATATATATATETLEGSPRQGLCAFPSAAIPPSLLDGVVEVQRRLAMIQRFAGDLAARNPADAVAGFAVGLRLVEQQLERALTQQLPAPRAASPAHANEPRAPSLDEMIPAFDDLWRCVALLRVASLSPGLSSLRELVEWVFSLFARVVEAQGLTLCHPIGQPFDPRSHEAIATQESAALPPGAVAAVHQLGLARAGRLLRPARVSVVRPAIGSG